MVEYASLRKVFSLLQLYKEFLHFMKVPRASGIQNHAQQLGKEVIVYQENVLQIYLTKKLENAS